jgi:hypothetical protein
VIVDWLDPLLAAIGVVAATFDWVAKTVPAVIVKAVEIAVGRTPSVAVRV